MSDFELEPLIEKPVDERGSFYRRPAWVEVDLDAIRNNVRVVRREIGDGVMVMAVVKADGYGHGALPVARAAVEAGADWLGVALTEEGIELRKDGVDAPVLILAEPPPSAAAQIIEYDLSATVCSYEFIEALDKEAARRGKVARLHLKIDTGMNRTGVPASSAIDLVKAVQMLPNTRLEGMFTHFAKAEDPASDLTDLQMDRFEGVLSLLPKEIDPIIHAANSAATFLSPRTHLDMVRVGISLYGLHPSPATFGRIDIQPALSLKARASFIKELAPGEGVSYGHTRLTEKPTTIITIPMGYGDGYTRRFSNIADVLIGGRRCRIIGNVCMDQFMVEGGQDEYFPEDEIVLIGRQGDERITADELADLLGTINYEIVCMINKRVPRIYLNK
ncbi:MAG: alanine racemase [Actinobacteria bacterium]|nr:alanine racemase [Actinomycetota bacterium]